MLIAYSATLFCHVMLLAVHDKDSMLFWLNITHFTGPLASTSMAYLAVAFYYDDRYPPLTLSISIILSVIPLLIRGACGYMKTVYFIPNPIGNIAVYDTGSLFFKYFYIHTFIIVLFMIIFLFIKYRTTRINRLRRLSLFLLTAVIITYVSSAPGNFIFPMLFEKYGIRIPEVGYIFLTILTVAIFIAVFRYQFSIITIPLTIEQVLQNIHDCIIITGPDGTAIQSNRAAKNTFTLLGRKKNPGIHELFRGQVELKIPDASDRAKEENPVDPEIIHHPDNLKQLLEIITQPVFDRFNDHIGFLIICRVNDKLEKAAEKYSLTRREVELIILLNEGLEYNEISEKMEVSQNTVRNHIQNIYIKTGTNNRVLLLKKVF